MQGIMIQGCSSDAGKSYVATALCRVLADKGFHVSPFKSQNTAKSAGLRACRRRRRACGRKLI